MRGILSPVLLEARHDGWHGQRYSDARAIVTLFSAAGVLFCAFLTGCAHHSRAENQQLTYVSKPVIDFGRGGGGMPIEGVKELRSAEDLLAGLTRGYHNRIELSKDHDPILIAGEFPRLDLLRVDLSDATLKKDYKPKQFKKPSAPQPVVFVKQFESLARPLRYHDAPMEW